MCRTTSTEWSAAVSWVRSRAEWRDSSPAFGTTWSTSPSKQSRTSSRRLTSTVLNAMALVIGGVAVISMIRSYLQQWTAGVVANPGRATGSRSSPLSTLARSRYPLTPRPRSRTGRRRLVDCAQAAGVELPTLAKVGSPVTWTAEEQEPGLITPGALTGNLDANLTQTMTYVTGNEDAGDTRPRAPRFYPPSRSVCGCAGPRSKQLRSFRYGLRHQQGTRDRCARPQPDTGGLYRRWPPSGSTRSLR